MSLLLDIADAITAKLNADGFPEPFTAVRMYRPEFNLKDLADLHVTVVPRAEVVEGETRATDRFDYAIDVAVQKKLATNDAGEIDDLMGLAELIDDRFRHAVLATSPNAFWVKSEIRVPYVPEHIEQHQVFTSVLTLTFRAMRDAV